MKLTTNTVLGSILAIVVLAGGYWYVSSAGTGNEPPLSTNAPVNTTQMKFETLVNELQSITFDTSIFTDARFKALVDIATTINPEPAGRLDPFAPITGISN